MIEISIITATLIIVVSIIAIFSLLKENEKLRKHIKGCRPKCTPDPIYKSIYNEKPSETLIMLYKKACQRHFIRPAPITSTEDLEMQLQVMSHLDKSVKQGFGHYMDRLEKAILETKRPINQASDEYETFYRYLKNIDHEKGTFLTKELMQIDRETKEKADLFGFNKESTYGIVMIKLVNKYLEKND